MAAIGFYHLTRTKLLAALPPLLGRSLAARARVLLVAQDPMLLASIDDALWRSEHPDWLPHGMAGGADDAAQPILLSMADHPGNQAGFLFLADGAPVPLDRFERVFDLFDGTAPDRVAAARTRWAAAKLAGHTLTYWRQEEAGWVKAG
jgi:DNA polymerase-3 subunit chi